jgi:hypothetical protein
MGQYHVGDFLKTQVFSHFRIIGQAHNFFPVFFWYHYLADHFPFILHSGIWWSPYSHRFLVFHEIVNMNLLCLLYCECELFILRTDKSFPSQKVIIDISYCLLKNKIITHWPFEPGLLQDWICSPHLYLDRICVLVCKITSHIAIAMQKSDRWHQPNKCVFQFNITCLLKNRSMPLTFGPGLYQDGICSPNLYLDRICVPCLYNNYAYPHRYVKSDRWHQPNKCVF